jgi:hypothetical protein
MGAAKKVKKTWNDMTIADRCTLRDRLDKMLGKFYVRYKSLHKITKYNIQGNTTTVYSDHPASPHVFVTAEFEDWLEEFTPAKIDKKKGDIVYDRRLFQPLDEDDGDLPDDDLPDDEINDLYDDEPDDGADDADDLPEPVKEEPVKMIKEMTEKEEPVKGNSAVVRKAVDDEIDNVLPILDVYLLDNLTAELTRQMSEVIMTDTERITPELIQKATTVNMLAGSIAKIHTDKISSAVLLAQNADAINKLLKQKTKQKTKK